VRRPPLGAAVRRVPFGWALAVITLAGFGVRAAYGLSAHLPNGNFGDDLWFHAIANDIATGRGFIDPFHSLGPHGQVLFGNAGAPIPTAFHLPLFPAMLALASAVGLDSYTAHQLIGCAFGASTVAVCGLIGRRLAGERAGLIVAAVAALYLELAINDSLALSESLYGLMIALVLLALLALREQPSASRALLFGAAVAAATLTRNEAVALGLLLAPLVVWAGGPGGTRDGRRGARNLALAALAAAVVCLPWCVRNTIVFHQPVGLTTGGGSVLAGANLPSTYYGDLLGAYDIAGLPSVPAGRHLARNEAVQSGRYQRGALRYARRHLGRVPLVALARAARTWSLYPLSPAQNVAFVARNNGHLRRLEYVALLEYLAVLVLAALGLRWLPRGTGTRWLLAAPLVFVTLVSVLAYGDVRFRQAANVALVVLAGIALARLTRLPQRRAARRLRGSGRQAHAAAPARSST